MSSLKVKLFMAFESFLRVPPLLIIDEIFRISFGLGHASNKHVGGLVHPPKTTYIPDRLELSESERLATTEIKNETGSYGVTPHVSVDQSEQTQSAAASFPVVHELWQIVSDTLYQVFNADPQQAGAAASETQTASSTIVEDGVVTTASSGYQPESPHLSGSYDLATSHAAADLIKVLEFILCLSLFFMAVITFMLATENLIKLYSHLISFLSLYVSYMLTPFPTALALATFPSLLYNVTCRSVLAVIYYACRSWPGAYNSGGENNSSVLGKVSESALFAMFFVSGATRIHPVLYVLLMVLLHHPLVRCLPDIWAFLKSSWNETKRVQNEYGLSHLIQVESGRLRVNTVFRLFWVTRAAYDAVSKCCNEPLNSMIRYVMTHGTETFTGIVGLTVTVSAICHHIGEGLLFLLYNGANTEADANRFGSISTVLFFILSLQTGLTSLDPEKRLDRLMKNIVLLGTALFHALHQMISPVLTAFRAFQTLQIRAAALSCSFFLVSGFLTYYLLCHSTISTWSLAVLALAIEFKIKIFISLLISFVVYLSQLVQYPSALEKIVHTCRRVLPSFVVRFFDHLHDELSHEDVVFYLRSVANVAEFLTGIFLFANAVWIFFFESASAIRAIGMSVHAYFNIWCEAQKGWRIYCQRKTASQKIMSLADATEEQLRSRQDDVCAVCYEEMESAKVTNCNHLFHAVCLRKWLYVQNTCPLCHEVLYREDALEPNENGNGAVPPLPENDEQFEQQGQPAENDNQNQNQPLHNTYSSTVASSASATSSARQSTFHRSNRSDGTDTEPETSSSRMSIRTQGESSSSRTTRDSSSGGVSELVATSSSLASSRRERTPLALYNGIRFEDFPSESENGNSSSGTDFTVDGSEGDELWAEDLSSSDNDDERQEGGPNGVRRPRQRGNAIGVPLLL